MVKFIKISLCSFCFMNFLWANSALEAAKNLLGNQAMDSKLELLFKDENLKDDKGYIDYARLMQILKTNSLLSVNSANSKDLELAFVSDTKGIIFVKALNDTLKLAGFVHFTPKVLNLETTQKKYVIEARTRYFFDVGNFYRFLKQNSIFIKDIKKIGVNSYKFELDFSNVSLKNNVEVGLNQEIQLSRPLKDYFFSLQNANSIRVQANEADSWFAKILFLDKDLEVVEAIYAEEKNNGFTRNIPNRAEYVVIGDNFNLDNIRRGLKVQLIY